MYINGKIFSYKRYSSREIRLLNSNLLSYVQNGKVEILFDNKESFFELQLIIDYYISNKIIVDLLLSYLPYQRMDHKDRDEYNTVSSVYSLLSKYNLHSVTVCEPHCDIKEFDGWKEFSYIFNLKQKVFEEIGFDEQKDTVLFTDHGGQKRYSGFAKNNVYCEKKRDINTGLICEHSLVGNLNTKGKVLIVDDIISTGDTIVSVIEMLIKKSVKDIYIFSGHFENNKFNRRLFTFNEVKRVFSTNSLKKRPIGKLKLFDIGELFYGKRNG